MKDFRTILLSQRIKQKLTIKTYLYILNSDRLSVWKPMPEEYIPDI